jgi:pimeloyl-ACP methyl ester carboxylesterase
VAGCSMPTTGAADQRKTGEQQSIKVDFLESCAAGPVVMLVHSSPSGARQWRRLMEDLKDRFRVQAVNLFGYGETPALAGRNEPIA